MENHICKDCNKSFKGIDEYCDSCKLMKDNSDAKLKGAIETLAVMRSYKELKKS